MKKLMTAVVVAACAANALAMPTKAELTKAQPLVAELMADDIAAFKAKTKKAEEVGDTSVKYAREASTEAAKFLLLKGAVAYYARGEAYDKAADAVSALRTEIADVPPAVVEEILRKNMNRVTAKKAPRLFAQYQTAQVQMSAAKEVAAAKAALAKKPKDAALTRKLAEAQALSGDWKAALESFAQLNNKAGTTAQAESEGKDLPDVADFWWTYESYLGEEDADVFKSHAAAIYKKCLADGTIEGLKKNVVEKRLKQVEVVAAPVTASEKAENAVAESSDKIAPKGAKQGKGMKLKIKNGVEIEFVQCPAGSFIMGRSSNPDNVEYKHKVVISRPFWMSKYPITVGQFDAFCPVDKEFTDRYGVPGDSSLPIRVPISMVQRYCDWINKRFKSSLPRKCICRLPTDAEWEYALFANSTDVDDPYVRFRDGERSAYREIWGETKPVVPVGTAGKPNAWGIYDMLGNGSHYVLDTINPEEAKNNYGWGIITGAKYAYSETETDPLRIFDGKDAKHLQRGVRCFCDPWGPAIYTRMVAFGYSRRGDSVYIQTFRLVIGPDLVGEWKAKHGKK